MYYQKCRENMRKNLFWVPQVWLKFNIFKVPRSHDIAWTLIYEDPCFHQTCLLVQVLNRNYESTCIFASFQCTPRKATTNMNFRAGSRPQMAECCETFGPFGPGSTWTTQEDKQRHLDHQSVKLAFSNFFSTMVFGQTTCRLLGTNTTD